MNYVYFVWVRNCFFHQNSYQPFALVIRTYVRTYVHTHDFIYIHTYIYACMHECTHATHARMHAQTVMYSKCTERKNYNHYQTNKTKSTIQTQINNRTHITDQQVGNKNSQRRPIVNLPGAINSHDVNLVSTSA